MYLTATEAESRLLSRFNITADLSDGDCEAASSALDELAPFTPDVAMALDADPSGATLPDALKDWLALYAYMLADDWPGPVVQDSMTPFSTHYAKPEPNKHAKRCRELIAPYLKRRGSRV